MPMFFTPGGVWQCYEIKCEENTHLSESRQQIKHDYWISRAHLSQMNDTQGVHGGTLLPANLIHTVTASANTMKRHKKATLITSSLFELCQL